MPFNKMPSRRDLISSCSRYRVVVLSGLMSLLLATTMGLPLESGSNDITLDEVGVWSEWRDWIPCTRSCGAGVTIQNRTCLRGTCVGPSVQYMSCCIQDCPEDHLGFRAEQCQVHNQGGSVQYVPAEEGNEGCWLRCVNPQMTSMSLGTFVRNGTSCKTVEGYDGLCLGKMCARVGCDSVLGSDKIEDKCLRCHSPTERLQTTCQRFAATSTPNQAAMEGNLPIVIIPEGAATITISHLLLPNEGTLALKSPTGTYYYTHGNDESLEDVAGAEFQRTVDKSGPHPMEVLTSIGPLSERITIELQGVHQSAPMVEYEYYITGSPDGNAGMHANHTVDIDESLTEDGSEYAWQYRPLSDCSVSCGTGLAVAMAMCEDLRHPGRDLPDSVCNQHLTTPPKPLPLVQKCHLQECQPMWSAKEWSQCSRSCGNGTQTRQLECRRFEEEGRAADKVSDDLCDANAMPEVERVCNTEQCYAEWNTGSWSQCPTQCGRWSQQRSVVCRETATGREVDSTHCDPTQKPFTTQPCVVPCSECYWYTSKFGKCDNACGYGTQTRRIRCRYVSNNHRANESCCEGLEIPERTQPCYDTRGSRCRPEWETHPYGQCHGDCCGEMRQERRVECTKVSSTDELIIFPDKECNETIKPETSSTCERTDCPRWNVTEWGECSATCGNGNRFRVVKCVQGDNVKLELPDEDCECSAPLKPTRVKSCELPTCPPVTETTNTLPNCESIVQEQCLNNPNCCGQDSFLMQLCAESCRHHLNS